MPDDDKKFTQADVDKFVQERLARDRETRGDPAALLLTVQNLQNELAASKQLALTLQGKVATTDRSALLTRVGVDLKVPQALMGFIQGDTDEAMRASAAALIAGIGPGQSIGGSTNPPAGNVPPKIYTSEELKTMTPEAINADWVNVSAQLKAGQVK
jgi:hypothetical protein